MWGFVAALSVILIWWVWQYRTTRQRSRHLLRRQLERVHERARRSGDALLRPADSDPHRLRGRAHRRSHRQRADLLMAPRQLAHSSRTRRCRRRSSRRRNGPISTHRSRRSRRTSRSTRAASASRPSPRSRTTAACAIHCYTTWDTPEQLEVFLEHGYTFERLLGDVGLSPRRAHARHGEALLMAAGGMSPRGRSPATATSSDDVRHSRAERHPRRGSSSRASSAIYLTWTLIVYFLEPGLR